MKYVTSQNISVLTGIAIPCALAFLSVGFSPAFAAALARGVDTSAALSAIRSMIVRLGAIREWTPPCGSCGRGAPDQIISLL